MASLGSLVVSLAANTAEFASDLGKAAHVSEQQMARIKREAEKAGKAIGLMFAAGVGVAAVLVKQAIDSQDAMLKMAQGAGVTTETMSELAFAAQLSGVEVNSFSTSITRLNRNISDTAAETGEARQAFAALGIDVMTADGALKNADAIMAEVADKFAQMEDGAGKSAIAVMLFGRAGADMIPFLNQGAEGIRKLREEAVALGASISSEAGRAAEQFNDNLTRLNQVKKGLANTIAQELLPTLNSLTDQLVETAKSSALLDDAARTAATGLRLLLTGGTLIVTVFKALGDAIGAVGAALVAIAQGEFMRAFEIAKMGVKDFEATTQSAATTILDIWEKTAQAAEQAGNRTARMAAPVVESIEQVNKARAAAEKAARAEQKALEDLEKQRQKEAELAREQALAKEELLNRLETQEIERRQRNIEAVAESLLTEEEREAEAFERRAQMIQDAHERMLISQEEAQALSEKLAEQHQKRLSEIRKRGLTDLEKFQAMSWSKQTQTVLDELVSLTAGVAQHNRTLFNINKAAAIAQAVINAYEGISLTLSKYPYPINIGLAAAHAAVAFAQVNAIASQSFQGGGRGAAPSLAGATAATPVTPVDAGGRPISQAQDQQRAPANVTIVVQGESISRKQLEDIATGLNELGEDGFPLFFSVKAA